jgi:hypothetical protein
MSLDFDGMAGNGVNRSKNRFAGNQSGLSATTNAGRGPTGGGASVPNRGRETFTGHAQVRNPSGTKEMPKTGKTSFDMGRGPTKGNQCC